MPITFEMDDASASSGLIVSLADLLIMLGISETATATQTAIATSALRAAQGAVIRHLHYNPLLLFQTEFYPRMNSNPVDGQGVWETEGDSAYFRNLTDAATTELQMARLPIREQGSSSSQVTSVWIDYDGRSGTRSGSFSTSSLKVEGEDFNPNYDTVDSRGYKVCRDGILRSEGRWPGLAGSVKVQYAAGYTEAELAGTDLVIDASPIREAVMDEAIRRVHKAYSRMKKRTGFGTGALSSESLGDYSYSADGALLAQLVGSNSDILAETALKLESFVNFGAMLSS